MLSYHIKLFCTRLPTLRSSVAIMSKVEYRNWTAKNGTVMKSNRVIDLRSDTVTKPSPAMRKAMAEAVVGDDVYGEDPTIIELETMVSHMTGMESALFVPTGCMGNLLAVMSHCTLRGAEMIVGQKQHIHKYEQGSYAQFGGVSATTLKNEPNGTMKLDEIAGAIRGGKDQHETKTQLICLESPHNILGGIPLSLEYLDEVRRIADAHGIKVHMDGARIFSAAVAQNVKVEEIAKRVHSLSFCLSKNLCCPVGSVLCGPKDFIERARRSRKALGGGMRQAGIIAAAGVYALNNNPYKMIAQDHQNALTLAKLLREIEGLKIVNEVETNMVYLDTLSIEATDVCLALERSDVPIITQPFGTHLVRLVTHNDVTNEDMHTVAQAFSNIFK